MKRYTNQDLSKAFRRLRGTKRENEKCFSKLEKVLNPHFNSMRYIFIKTLFMTEKNRLKVEIFRGVFEHMVESRMKLVFLKLKTKNPKVIKTKRKVELFSAKAKSKKTNNEP